MTTELKDDNTGSRYRVMSVKKTTTPAGLPDGDWYRYVIGQGRGKIEGLRAGTLQTVTEHANSVADDLNERGSRGFSYSVTQKRKKG
jgi:hypothetical protein